MKKLLTSRVLFLALILGLLSGCGFQLRGNIDLDPGLKRMHLQGVSQFSRLGINLRQALNSSGVEVVEKLAQSDAILRISNVKFDRRLLSVSSLSGKVNEYELRYSFAVSLEDRKGKQLLAPKRLQQIRDYTYDEANVLGKGNEESRLRTEMEKDLVRQVLRRLQAKN